MNLLPVSLYLVSVLVLSLFNIINSRHVLSFLSHTFLYYQCKPPSHDFCHYITLTLCLSFRLSPFLSSLSGQDSASQFLVPGILIAVGMLLLVTFVFVAAYCIR